jgi:methyl-accepting chemotaxis protein
MIFLSRCKIRTKLTLLLGLFALGLVALAALDGSALHQRMLTERIGKLKATVEMMASYAAAQDRLVAAGTIGAAQALARLRDMAHAVRFDGGTGYLTLQSMEGMVLIHGTDPGREDKLSTARDGNGIPLLDLIHDALRTGDSGTISYLFPKPGQTQPQPKIAYVQRAPALKGFLLAGTYTDDLDADFRGQMMSLAAIGAGILLVTLILAWLVGRDIGGSLQRLKGAMAALADGRLDTQVPGTARRDEIGEMAAAVQIFKDNALSMERLKTEREADERRVADEKKRVMAQLAGDFESQVSAVVDTVAAAASEMERTAGLMTAASAQTVRQVSAASAASDRASSNVLSVADAAQTLSGSVAEITRQVAFSSEIAAKAVTESERTNALVGGLTEAAQKIGAVTNMINEIAGQTNLLALNATIEAARAGEAGKGFAVVASEVKNLASQTAKATQEISGHIAAMQSATGETVAAVQSIGATIGQLNETAATIAAAVEEQGAATRDIARNVQQAAAGTSAVAGNLEGATQAVTETGAAATQVHGAAAALSRQAVVLRGQVGQFLAAVRAG